MADGIRARLGRVRAAGFLEDARSRGDRVRLVRHSEAGTAVAAGSTLEEAISKAEALVGIRVRAQVAPDVYRPPAGIRTTSLIPTHEGVEADLGRE